MSLSNFRSFFYILSYILLSFLQSQSPKFLNSFNNHFLFIFFCFFTGVETTKIIKTHNRLKVKLNDFIYTMEFLKEIPQ